MTYPTATLATQALAQRDMLCAQAVRVLCTTAKQWGMRVEQPLNGAQPHRPYLHHGAASCARLLAQDWAVAA